MRISLLFTFVIGFVIVLYSFGYNYSLLWHWWWYDSVLHALGGVAIGIFAVRLSLFTGIRDTVLAIVLGILIGLGWEIFEWMLGMPRSVFLTYAVDTTKDIVFDICGVFIGLFIARRV